MTTPTDRSDDRMPGVTDFEVTLPFTRRTGGHDETTALRVRVPAGSNSLACRIGGTIAECVGLANGDRWMPLLSDITAVDVSNVPDPVDLAAQVKHWQRIVAVIAEKYPTMVQVSAAEYAAADPTLLMTVQTDDDTIMYATERTLKPITSGTVQSTFLLPAPDVEGAEQYGGGHPDPDVRGMMVQNLPVLPFGKVEMLHGGRWMPIAGVGIGADLSVTVTCITPLGETDDEEATFTDLEQVVAIRPATVRGAGDDLPAAATHGRQMLTGEGWWAIAEATYTGPTGRAYDTVLVKAGIVDRARRASIGADDDVLLRDQPPGWWA